MKNQPTHLTRDQVRQVDRIAIEEYGIPGILLMENASRAVVDEIIGPNHAPGQWVLVVCGGGNNGGDGYAIARIIHNRGAHNVRVVPLAPIEHLTGDARTMADIALKCGVEVADRLDEITSGNWDCVVDAVFGTGLSRPPEGRMIEAISAINAAAANGQRVLAVDVPSGLACDTGRPLGVAVRAGSTVTFVARKSGFDAPEAFAYTGHVIVADIGTPPSIVNRILDAETPTPE
jgi:NAD(P)H-hydrate epimerase